MSLVRSRRADLLAELETFGGRGPATADPAEPTSAEFVCEESTAVLQELSRQALTQWHQEESALET
eukprot:2776301-Karenia_brevis.AAC.1